MRRIVFALLAAAGLAIAVPSSSFAQSDAADEIEEAGARLSEEEARRILASSLPAGASRQAQIDHYLARQRAAFTLGNSTERIAALRKLVELTDTPERISPHAGFLWRELVRYGNQTEAFELGESLVSDRRTTPEGRIILKADLGLDYAALGERDKAARLLREVDEGRRQLAPSLGPRSTAYLEVSAERLRAAVLHANADPEGSYAAIKRALAASQAEVKATRALATTTGVAQDRAIRQRNGTMTYAVWLYFVQGRNEEAEALARQGMRLAAEEKTGGAVLGYWQSKLGQALLGARRYEESAAASREAIASMQAAGVVASSVQAVNARVVLMQALFGLERWAEADQVAQALAAATADDFAARGGIADNPVLVSFLHLRNGRLEQAKERIEGSVRYRQRWYGSRHPISVEALGVRAMVRQAMGESFNALDDYREVLAFVFAPDSSYSDAQPSGLRGFILPQVLRGFLELARERHAAGKSDEALADLAFRVADRLQSSVVQQALIDSAARLLATTPDLAALARKEQERRAKAREGIARLNRELAEEGRLAREGKERIEKAKAAKQDPAAIAALAKAERERIRASQAELKTLREELETFDKARGEHQREISQRFPAYYALVNPKPPTLAGLAKLLAKDELFVSVYPTSTGTYVWAVPAEGSPAMHVSPMTKAQVAEAVAALRRGLDVGERPDPGRAPVDTATAHRLYAELLGPARATAPGARVITVATASELGQVPLAALVTKPAEGPFNAGRTGWLVREAAISQVATAAAFRALREAGARAPAKSAFFGFGDPLFSSRSTATKPGAVRSLVRGRREAGYDTEAFDYGSIPALPETRDEIAAIAKALGADPSRDALYGARATRAAALATDLSDRRVVAFATHGLKPGDLPGLSRPALALAATADGASPLLVMDDVLTLKLQADTVVLSACNTASDDGRALEAYSGLARAFFFAGARSVLATHWAVETISARELVTRTFAHQAANPGTPRAESLRQAQLALLDGTAGPGFSHPFYWAPYALTGDPSR